LRVVPEPDRRVVLVASHTEAPMVSPIGFTLGVLPLAAPGHRAPGEPCEDPDCPCTDCDPPGDQNQYGSPPEAPP
jgi:hypothetical protein